MTQINKKSADGVSLHVQICLVKNWHKAAKSTVAVIIGDFLLLIHVNEYLKAEYGTNIRLLFQTYSLVYRIQSITSARRKHPQFLPKE